MDMGSTNASREYLKNAVMTAPPEQLQLMLFDGAIRFTLRGQDALHNKDFEGAFNGFDRAQRIVLQLIAGLKPEVNPELVEQMSPFGVVYEDDIELALNQHILKMLNHFPLLVVDCSDADSLDAAQFCFATDLGI